MIQKVYNIIYYISCCIFDINYINCIFIIIEFIFKRCIVIRLLVAVLEGVAPARLSVAALRRSQPLNKSKQNQKVRVALQKVAECSSRAKNPDWTVLSTNSNLKERILNKTF